MRTADASVGARLDVRDLTFIRTFSKGSWLSTIYMPPMTAQFLNNVSFQVFHGEVHGIIGAAGCGKSTLLQVLANRAQGSVTGDVVLNGQDLTDERFTNLCEFVNFNMQPLEFLTVEQSIRYHAQLSLNCNAEAVTHRALNLMQQFDLMPYAQTLIFNLTKSALKRLILVLHLVKDPGLFEFKFNLYCFYLVLILVDDPLSDIDALSGYQLVASLRNHVKQNSRMAIITLRSPRSDIYQLLSQLTLLFYGEIVYSGPTKYMPHYFSQIGYRCPITENPAVYYLSLASCDRETPESYAETQSKAANLVDIFKKRRAALDFSAYHDQALSETPVLSCYFGRPNVSRLLCVLFSRCLLMFIRVYSCISAQFLLLTATLFVASFGGRFYSVYLEQKHSPQSVAGTIFALTFFTGLSSIFCTVYSFKETRATFFWEVSSNWLVYPAFSTHNLFALVLTISCTYLFYKLLVLLLFVYVSDVHKLTLIAITICCLSSTLSSGFLKSYQSFVSTNEWLLYLTNVSPERFGNLVLFNEFINKTRVPSCRRNEQQQFARPEDFCRWRNGYEFLAEILLDPNNPPEYWQSVLIIFIASLATFVSYFLITNKRAQQLCSK
ncbi:ATP-binding cassette sub-family G member 5 [Aphelenchoides bicaudatus]|nr:ATP-binding cassette sub-family G member 5 [Aphelenchoides bicaudatus]